MVEPQQQPSVARRVGEQHHGQPRMAYRLAERFGGLLLFVHGLGWLYWDGHRWAEDDRGRTKQAVLTVLREAFAESVGGDKTLRADAKVCESDAGVRGVLSLASALPPFAATVALLDVDPWLLNVGNGTLDLRTMTLRPHDPADRITKVTRAAWHPEVVADGQRWRGFLERVLPDAPVREFLQRVVGLALLGTVVEHVLPILTGHGMNGKTTLYEAVCWALGDYAAVAEPDLFMHRDGAHPTGEMDLLGRRFVVMSESDRERKLAEATVKRLTGGDRIKARRMHKDFVEFTPSHTMVLVTNFLPRVSEDPAVWRRLRVIPFDVRIGEDEKDGHLPSALQLDCDAVLSWAVEGYRQYVEAGLGDPDAVTAATSGYRADSDAVTRFIGECCMTGPTYTEAAGALYERWTSWVKREGGDPGPPKALGMAFDRLGYTATKTRAERRRTGLMLYADESP